MPAGLVFVRSTSSHTSYAIVRDVFRTTTTNKFRTASKSTTNTTRFALITSTSTKLASNQVERVTMWILLVLSQLHQLAAADYCEFGLCEDEQQYCCGENKCCSKNSNLWFFWAAILVVVFILVIVAICNRKPQKDPHGPYEKLATSDIAEAT